MSVNPVSTPAPRTSDVLSELVVVTGAAGALGGRVCALLAADPAVTETRALDRRPVAAGDRPVDLLTDDLEPSFEGATSVMHFASAFGPALDDDPAVCEAADVKMASRMLAAASAAGVAHLVVLSSATVYGAWANNPVPLTEDSPLRPNPKLAAAVQQAEIERLVGEWRELDPSRTVAILRPAPAVAEGHAGWLAKALRAAGSVRALDDDPPAQFVHFDDLAQAAVALNTARSDGAFNVAADGWLSPNEFRELAGASAKVRAPRWLADRLAAVRWRLRLAPSSPGAQAYSRGSFVVANDKLRAATGWQPTHSNEEAYVAAVPAGRWATVSPRRRQELALGGSAGLVASVVAATVVLLRRRARSNKGKK